MSVILGILGNLSVAASVYLSFAKDGETQPSYGFAVFFSACFALTGLVLGFVTVQNKDYYKALPVLGMILNLAALGLVAVIFYFSGELA